VTEHQSADGSRRVLLVEDDEHLRTTLAMLLEDAGVVTSGFAMGEPALAAFDEVDPDLAIVDLRLPGMGGVEVVRAIRQRSDVAVMILTAQAGSADVVAGLDAGADDYVTKPFVVDELLARVRAHLRRSSTGSSQSSRGGEVAHGPLQIRPATAEVLLEGAIVPVTRTELKLLLALARAGGGVMSKEEILREVWRYDYLGDSRMVDAHVRRLRLKIEQDPAHPRLLLTVRGLGYRLSGGDDGASNGS
jgi:DNA-binding response OmpR family regulator